MCERRRVCSPAPGGVRAMEARFLMVNLYPRHTGLPMTVWAGPRAGARH